MEFEFDPAKDAANIAKHGVSLSRAVDMVIDTVSEDRRFAYGEVRFRAFGLLNGEPHCLAFTYRGSTLRAVSFRRTHWKEYRRYVQ